MSLRFAVPSLLVGFDVETTGLDPQRDEPISYGFAEFADGVLLVVEEFHVLPDAPIHPAAQRVHGQSIEDLRERFRRGAALTPAAGSVRAVERLLAYAARGAVFVGANPMFDFSMLDAVLRRGGFDGLAGVGFELSLVEIVDVIARDWMLDPDRAARPRRGLTNLAEHYGVRPGEHRALEDARAAVEVFVRQCALASRLRSAAEVRGSVRPSSGLRWCELEDPAWIGGVTNDWIPSSTVHR